MELKLNIINFVIQVQYLYLDKIPTNYAKRKQTHVSL